LLTPFKSDVALWQSGVVVYFECIDLDERPGRLLAKGFEFIKLPINERWLWREARLNDPDNNVLCLYNAGEKRKYPPWRIGESDS